VKIAFIGDIVGKPGRQIVGRHLKELREKYALDFVIANYENASHGYGLTEKNCRELLEYGIDMMSGGNHSFDKKEIFSLFDRYPLIRPLNYPCETPGEGIFRMSVCGKELAVINLMGHYTMPMTDNPFTKIMEAVESLEKEGIRHIVIDMHAEASSEKQALFHLLKRRVSAILGTHTHVGTDDLMISEGCCYVTDVGLTGCRDGVIGMEPSIPVKRFLTGIGSHFDVPDRCKSILQVVIFELDEKGRCTGAEKRRVFDDGRTFLLPAVVETYP